MIIFDKTKCFVCDSKIEKQSSSTHVFSIKYECGCEILGALDSETYGEEFDLKTECPNLEKIKEKYQKV